MLPWNLSGSLKLLTKENEFSKPFKPMVMRQWPYLLPA
jgi:hypothetical protein